MKNKKLLGVPLIAILVFALIATGGVLAAIQITKTLTGQLVIAPTDYDITLWKDSACTIPATSISWEAKVGGSPVSTSFWIKNEGSNTIYCKVTDDLNPSTGDIDWGAIGSNWMSISSGQNSGVTGTVVSALNKGTYSFTVTIQGASTSSG
jgi:hypothetical protein